MTQNFDYFVVFAEMRTGSNFLEANLNALEGVTCHGEAFNPHFIGYPNSKDILGITQDEREADPTALVNAIKADPKALGGFRFFHDHDSRILNKVLDDPRCAKIVLTRNPMESYVSWKIAKETGQWKLTDVRRRKESKIAFDGKEFLRHVTGLQAFQIFLMNTLQKNGQTAFYIAYEDLQDVEVMNGLAKFLGVDGRLDALDSKLKRQNPSPLSDKVSNFESIPAALSELDQFNLNRTPNFEPRRGAAVPTYVACQSAGLLYMGVPCGPNDAVQEWMAAVDGTGAESLLGDMNQKLLRQWKRRNRPNRSFTVLRHPVARAHQAFCSRILQTGEGSFSKIRRTLIKRYGLDIPMEMEGVDYSIDQHRAAFKQFLGFVKANLAGQNSVRQDGAWASQSVIIEGFGNLFTPDLVLREAELKFDLPSLAERVGAPKIAYKAAEPSSAPYALSDVYDDEIEDLTRDTYQRDYIAFGFDRWDAD